MLKNRGFTPNAWKKEGTKKCCLCKKITEHISEFLLDEKYKSMYSCNKCARDKRPEIMKRKQQRDNKDDEDKKDKDSKKGGLRVVPLGQLTK